MIDIPHYREISNNKYSHENELASALNECLDEIERLRAKAVSVMTEEEASERAFALLSLLESDFGQSGRDVRLMAIRDELMGVSTQRSRT